jgi:alpha-galactosidase
MNLRFFMAFVAAAVLAGTSSAGTADKPLKVYILVGQSNMQGTAHVKTFPHMAMDPASKALLAKLADADGKPRVYDDVRVAYLSGGRSEPKEKTGPLTVGFGGDGTNPETFGPEFGFGVTLREKLGEPFLIIKTAWGGKSINTDFRPPSAGPYPFSEEQIKTAIERKKITEKELKAKKAEATGHYYRLMAEFVKKVLADPGKYHPAYKPDAGHEIAGFVWFQGWNDMVDGGTYPDRYNPGGYDKYTEVLAHFIRDVRKEFKAPKMPFVIGVLGVGGPTKDYESPRYKGVHQNFRDAMAAPASMPEFKGNVKAVLTERFWPADVAKAEGKQGTIRRKVDTELKEKQKAGEKPPAGGWGKWKRDRTDELMKAEFTEEDRRLLEIGKANAGFHYLGSAKCYSMSGEAFAEAMAEMHAKR